MRRLLAAPTLAITLALGACAHDAVPDERFRSSPATAASQALVIRLIPRGSRPTASAVFLDRTEPGSTGTYSWANEGSVIFADATEEYLVVDQHLSVPWGTVIRIEGADEIDTARLGVARRTGVHTVDFDVAQELHLADGTDVLRADPGSYTLDLFAHWGSGYAMLAFGIDITRIG